MVLYQYPYSKPEDIQQHLEDIYDEKPTLRQIKAVLGFMKGQDVVSVTAMSDRWQLESKGIWGAEEALKFRKVLGLRHAAELGRL